MTKQIIWSDEARADLRAIDRATALRLLESLARYKSTGVGDVKQLADYDPPQFRLRVGDYRIRFRRVNDEVVQVVRVLHRREAYRV